MMCFKDRTWCSAKCATADCYRNFTPEMSRQAETWWGKPGAPVCFADLWQGCEDYKSVEEDKEPHK